MRTGKLVGALLVIAVFSTGCNLLPAKKSGPELKPPETAPLDCDGYGQLQLVAEASADYLPSPAGGVAVSSDGDVYVTDAARNLVLLFPTGGILAQRPRRSAAKAAARANLCIRVNWS